MSQAESGMVGDSFKLGYRFQKFWDRSMATAFFFGELGGGLFLVSLYFNFVPGMILGLISTGIGKPYFHITHMGVPFKSWRAILRPDRSWISRGLLSIMTFIPMGTLVVLDTYFDWSQGGMLGSLVQLLAIAAALVVITYQGFAMSHSSAFALWNTGLMPISSMIYALTVGTFVALAVGWEALGENTVQVASLAMILLVALFGVIMSLMHASYHGTKGGRQSVELLTKTLFAKLFLPLVLGAGIIVPLLLMWFFRGNMIVAIVSAILVLVGFYTYRVLMFKAAVYEPQVSYAARFGLV